MDGKLPSLGLQKMSICSSDQVIANIYHALGLSNTYVPILAFVLLDFQTTW